MANNSEVLTPVFFASSVLDKLAPVGTQ